MYQGTTVRTARTLSAQTALIAFHPICSLPARPMQVATIRRAMQTAGFLYYCRALRSTPRWRRRQRPLWAPLPPRRPSSAAEEVVVGAARQTALGTHDAPRCHLCKEGLLRKEEALLHEWVCEGPLPPHRAGRGSHVAYDTDVLQRYYFIREQRQKRSVCTLPLTAAFHGMAPAVAWQTSWDLRPEPHTRRAGGLKRREKSALSVVTRRPCTEEGGSFVFSVQNPRLEQSCVWCAVSRYTRDESAIYAGDRTVTPLMRWNCPPSLPGLPSQRYRVTVPYGVYAFYQTHMLALYLTSDLFKKATTQLTARSGGGAGGLAAAKVVPSQLAEPLLVVEVLHHVATTPIPSQQELRLLLSASSGGGGGHTADIGNRKRTREEEEEAVVGSNTTAAALAWPDGLSSPELSLCLDHLLHGRSVAVYGIGSKYFFLHHVAQSAELRHYDIVVVDASWGGEGASSKASSVLHQLRDVKRKLAATAGSSASPADSRLKETSIAQEMRYRGGGDYGRSPALPRDVLFGNEGRIVEDVVDVDVDGDDAREGHSQSSPPSSSAAAAAVSRCVTSCEPRRDDNCVVSSPVPLLNTSPRSGGALVADWSAAAAVAVTSPPRSQRQQHPAVGAGRSAISASPVPPLLAGPAGVLGQQLASDSSSDGSGEYDNNSGGLDSSSDAEEAEALRPVALRSLLSERDAAEAAGFNYVMPRLPGSLVGVRRREGEGEEDEDYDINGAAVTMAGISSGGAVGDVFPVVQPRFILPRDEEERNALIAACYRSAPPRCVQWLSLPSATALRMLADHHGAGSTQEAPLISHAQQLQHKAGWKAPTTTLLVIHNVDLLDAECEAVLHQLCMEYGQPQTRLQLLLSFDRPAWTLSAAATALEKSQLALVHLRSLLLPRIHETQHVNTLALLTSLEAAAMGKATGGSHAGGGSHHHLAAGSLPLPDTIRRVLYSLPAAFSDILALMIDKQTSAGESLFISVFAYLQFLEEKGLMVSQGRMKAVLRELTSNRLAMYDAAEHALMLPQPRKLRKILEEVTAQRAEGGGEARGLAETN